LTTDVFAFPRHKINRSDPDENIYWNLWPSAANFFELTTTENGAVSKTYSYRSKRGNATYVTLSTHVRIF